MGEKGASVRAGDAFEREADRLVKGVLGAGADLAQDRLEFAEGVLDNLLAPGGPAGIVAFGGQPRLFLKRQPRRRIARRRASTRSRKSWE
jgi:hypothetical protein